MMRHPDGNWVSVADLRGLAAMTARAEAAERDAARYRWLRDVGDETWTALVVRARQAFPHVPHSEVPSMVDEIINGAIDRERGND